jgi:hypothetical protein
MLLLKQITAAAVLAASSGEGKVAGQLPAGLEFVFGMGVVIVCVVWQILQLGFLRTAFTDGARQQEPKTLLAVGRVYFWKMLRFQVILGLTYQLIAVLGAELIIATMYKGVAVASLPVWIAPTCAFVGLAVLAKPMLLCPALIIIEGCMVIESFRRLKHFKLSVHSKLVKIFFGFLVMVFVFEIIEGLTKSDGTGHYIIAALQALIAGAAGLIVSLCAIGFVAGENETDDRGQMTEDKKETADFADGTD